MRTLSALAILAVLLVLGALGGRFFLFAVSPLSQMKAEGVIVEIHKGQSQKELTHLLVQEGAIPSDEADHFLLLGRVSRYWKKVKAGEYKLTPAMTPMRIFSTLASGISVIHSITVREGENMYELATAIEAAGLAPRAKVLALCQDPKFIGSMATFKDFAPKTLEGYLFPDTYFFNKTMTAEDMIHQMIRHFASVWGPEQEARAKQLGMTRHEVITLASIVEKETGVAQERPMISGVFHNRLKKKMRLQSDPTTIYGMWDRYQGNIHKSDLLVANPFNTYVVPALPVGPISNPGKDAIQAALFPANNEFLYFVSHNDGTHQFSRTYEEHLGAVKKFQIDPSARQGKSWRNAVTKKPQTNHAVINN